MADVIPISANTVPGLANLEAEQALLGACLNDSSIAADLPCAAHDFHEPLHARIFEAIHTAAKQGRRTGALLLRPLFESDPDIELVGGVVYLAQLCNCDVGMASDLAYQITDLAQRRRTLAAFDDARVKLLDTREDAPSAAEIVARIFNPDDTTESGLVLPGILRPSEWTGKNPPPRRFIIPGWVIRGACGLLSGQEGVGKSLLAQQMATCAAIGREFLGLEMVQANAMYVTCEDPMDELWRRQEDINAALGIEMEDLFDRLVLVSLKGEIGNELGTFDQAGRLHVSQRYRQIEKQAKASRCNLIFLDNAAHLFPGNENARHEVAVFLGLLEKLSEAIDGAVVLLAHPNKQHAQGNKQGNEFSGSTGWSAHVRNRLFLDWAMKDNEGNFLGDDGRVLRKSKANYGKKGEEINFRWHKWAFVRDADLPEDTANELRDVGRANFENECFIACLRQRNSEKRAVSENPASRTHAPKVFLEMPEARGCTREQMEQAMDRLFRLGAIERGFLWVDRGEGKARHGIREASANGPADVAKVTNRVSADLPLTPPDFPPTSEGKTENA